MDDIKEPDRIDTVETSYEKVGDAYEITVKVLDQDGNGIEGADVILSGYGAYSSVINSIKGTDKSTPHGVTDENGYASITVHFDNLKSYGTLNVEVSKTGYSGSSVSMKVFA